MAGDAPGPTEASICFLTLRPAHHLVSHLISVPQTTLATSWFLLSLQHNDSGQEWPWLSRDDPQQWSKRQVWPDGSCLTSLATQHGLISLYSAHGMPYSGSFHPKAQCSFQPVDLRCCYLHPLEMSAWTVPRKQVAGSGEARGHGTTAHLLPAISKLCLHRNMYRGGAHAVLSRPSSPRTVGVYLQVSIQLRQRASVQGAKPSLSPFRALPLG